MARSRAAAHAAAPFEDVDGLRLKRGGKNGYKGVRGGQGRAKNKYQGVTPRKTHRTALCDSPRAAAIAFAQMAQRIALCHLPQNNAAVTISASVSLPDFGAAASGVACVSSRPLGPISCALLRPEQAAAAVARGVAVAMAEELPASEHATRGL
tara:strand:- start:59 stop:517 length:459 start_codon:yes stop_codon:yes gene_type:complete